MKKHFVLTIICTFYFSISGSLIIAQPRAINTLQRILAAVDSFNISLPAEQLYLHFDKNNYAVGDTLWFKAYLLKRSTNEYSPLSGILYVELISDSNRLVKRLSFPAAYGLSWGQISLDKEDVAEGNYFIRAYTNWMQNFGDEYFFQRSISISAPLTANWLIKENHTIASAGDNIDFTLQLNGTDYRPEKQKEIDLKIVKGKKVLYRQDVRTNAVGIIKGNFSVPENTSANSISIVVTDKADPAKRSTVPLSLNRPQNIDLQLMPESGNLVAGISSKVGFKAISESGLGVQIAGEIVDSKNRKVASFRSIHRGMGFFEFTPDKNESYAAVVNLPGGDTKHYPLPAVKNSGIILQFDNDQNSDSIKLKIKVSPDLTGNNTYNLVGLTGGVVYYGANVILRKTEINARIAKKAFPSGVAHFTLMNVSGQPVNDRMLFIDHQDNLVIDIRSFKNTFSARDSIPLHIKVTDKQGNPVFGSFSLSVTDDAQVKTDDARSENIVTRMLLTTDLKGNIEAPDYYTNDPDSITWQALDALMLTQGWIGYNWQKIMKLPTPVFAAEPQFSVRGKVTNLVNAPLNKAHVVLMTSGSGFTIRDTVTNKKGEFIFTGFTRLDSLHFFLDARTAKAKKFGVGITVDEFKPAELKRISYPDHSPWYVNSDSTIVNYAQNKQRIESLLYQSGKYKRLQEVKINIKKVVRGSLNLNGPGGADQIIDEAEIEKEVGKKKNLLQLLNEKVKGFRTIYPGGTERYKINNDNVLFIIDGISLRNFGTAKETLEYLDAEDVRGIEVMNRGQYTGRYRSNFLDLNELMSFDQVAFIEITTRSGNGIFFKKIPGVMIYKPFPVTYPVQFYSPKYAVKNNNDSTKDLRSTIYWNPNLLTGKNGEAHTYFYAADTPTTYSLTIQGSDLKGLVGYKLVKISIK
ncbi:MAG TPA: hypothetical protein VMY77_05840 [Chitinophagaceae bacterium]|nr:hypothetical protein [Chitinophagaceae bacterium]